MKIQLISKPSNDVAPLAQVLINRGISVSELYHYTHTTDDDISEPELLGEDKLQWGAKMLIEAIQNNKKVLDIVDCDCDGYTSSALLMNYLHDLFPSWVENNLDYYMHTGKQHGLSDCIDGLLECPYSLVLLPDAGSNDVEYHRMLRDDGTEVICLDHHECDVISNAAVVINNQMCDYPNKFLSGVGVTWQFCRYIDKLMGTNHADKYIDLVALGNCGDMMSLLSVETAHLIRKGFQPDNIRNPFFYSMWQKNKFKLGDNPTPIGVAFYVVPFINAITRSGTQEEKKLIFESMLSWKAFAETFSTKRGHAFGEMERLVDQAIRVATNVKNRQTKAETAGMEYLEGMIESQNLLDHKVLLFLLEDEAAVPSTIRGLVANKFMAKYQRPVCVLTKSNDSYAGSARGYTASGIADFKAICEQTELPNYATGHSNAFGLSLKEEDINNFRTYTDDLLKDMTSEPVYRVDYILHNDPIYDEQVIMTLAAAAEFYGQDVSEPLLALTDVKITSDMITLMKGNTLKITLPSGIPILKFGATDEEVERLCPQQGSITVDFVCRGNINEWNGNVSAQLMLVDYEVKQTIAWEF